MYDVTLDKEKINTTPINWRDANILANQLELEHDKQRVRILSIIYKYIPKCIGKVRGNV